MTGLVRMPLEGGWSLLVRVDHELDQMGRWPGSGPVRAGRVGDRVEEVVTVASRSLREALEPVTQMSRQVLDQLGQARPREVQVEFGVELTAQAGAVLARAGTECHLTVTLTGARMTGWRRPMVICRPQWPGSTDGPLEGRPPGKSRGWLPGQPDLLVTCAHVVGGQARRTGTVCFPQNPPPTRPGYW
jgi:hypothetical protein